MKAEKKIEKRMVKNHIIKLEEGPNCAWPQGPTLSNSCPGGHVPQAPSKRGGGKNNNKEIYEAYQINSNSL